MNILVCILTSHDIASLRRAYASVVNQRSFAAAVVIIVNTLDASYVSLVRNEFPSSNVVETESNGSPGKGHNSCIDYFVKHRDADYMFLLDGDDLYYPCAFEQMDKALRRHPDVLMLITNDRLEDCTANTNTSTHVNLPYKFALNTLGDVETNWWGLGHDRHNPFVNAVWEVQTPARLLAISRKAVNLHPDKFRFDEELKLYDDYPVFLDAMLCTLVGVGGVGVGGHDLNVQWLSNTYVYVYNTITENSATAKYKKLMLGFDEERMFRSMLETKYACLKDKWRTDCVPIQYLGKPTAFSVQDKAQFCVDTLVLPVLNDWLNEAKALASIQKYDDALRLLDKLRCRGVETAQVIATRAVCLAGTGLVDEACVLWKTQVADSTSEPEIVECAKWNLQIIPKL